MKLNLNKKPLKSLSHNNKRLPVENTPRIAGGWTETTGDCIPNTNDCGTTVPKNATLYSDCYCPTAMC